jgi:hypothetical protein
VAEGNRWCSVVIPTVSVTPATSFTALAGDVVVRDRRRRRYASEIAFAWIHGRPIIVVKGRGGWPMR